LVQDFLEQSAARLPDKTARVCAGGRFSYADLDAMANRFAWTLIALGVRRGDRVAVNLGNGVEAVVAIFGTLKAGGVFAVVNPSTKRDKLRYILQHSRATVLVAEDRIELEELMVDCPAQLTTLRGLIRCGKPMVRSADDVCEHSGSHEPSLGGGTARPPPKGVFNGVCGDEAVAAPNRFTVPLRIHPLSVNTPHEPGPSPSPSPIRWERVARPGEGEGLMVTEQFTKEQVALQDFTFSEALARSPGTQPLRQNIDLDLACLVYTSGTTGEAKGVMSDHSNVVFASGSIIEYLENRESDIIINVLPLSFDYGLYQLLMTFRFGGTLVLEKSFAYPASILKTIERERVTGLPGVPTLYAMLLKMDLSGFDLSSLRYLTNTAAALPVNHIIEIRRRFPAATLFSMYGVTETKRTLYLPPEELDRRPGSVGIPIPGTEAWIEDPSGKRVGPGQIGELVVRGRHVMRGYWDDPAATARRFRPGPISGERLCYTGDLFRTDEDGFFYFVGRSDDIIKSRGEKVAPKEIENVLYELEDVVEAAVVGVPDPLLGQAIKAFVVVRNGALTPKQVLTHCRARLEDYMMPKYVEFRKDLPKTESGKIMKTRLA